jgi:hypothetical protein
MMIARLALVTGLIGKPAVFITWISDMYSVSVLWVSRSKESECWRKDNHLHNRSVVHLLQLSFCPTCILCAQGPPCRVRGVHCQLCTEPSALCKRFTYMLGLCDLSDAADPGPALIRDPFESMSAAAAAAGDAASGGAADNVAALGTAEDEMFSSSSSEEGDEALPKGGKLWQRLLGGSPNPGDRCHGDTGRGGAKKSSEGAVAHSTLSPSAAAATSAAAVAAATGGGGGGSDGDDNDEAAAGAPSQTKSTL